jgi:hypothetical protein
MPSPKELQLKWLRDSTLNTNKYRSLKMDLNVLAIPYPAGILHAHTKENLAFNTLFYIITYPGSQMGRANMLKTF